MAKKKKKAKSSSKSKRRKSRLDKKLPLLNRLEGHALVENLEALAETIEKLKKTELALQAEVQEIKSDSHTARIRFEAAERKVREGEQRKARAGNHPRSQSRSPSL